MPLQWTIEVVSKSTDDVLLQVASLIGTCIISDSHSITVDILTHLQRYCRIMNDHERVTLSNKNAIHASRKKIITVRSKQ